MSQIVFLLEEPSMSEFLKGLLPRLFPELPFLCIPHQGKQDLERSIRSKLRGWNTPGDRFVIVRDNDGADCVQVKNRLKTLCSQSGRSNSLVRIACQELEAWYFGDLAALADAFQDKSLRDIGRKKQFRKPDEIRQPSRVLEKLIPGFGKLSSARKMADCLTPDGNRSPSFQVFVSGVEHVAAEMGLVGPRSGETDR